MNANKIRQKYLDFMVKKGHVNIAPAPLVLTDDPTTLFTGSGMQPLMHYLLGEEHPSGTRLTDSQPCMRLQDIDEVGDLRHTTTFEMLGNWSLGDYFKEEQIENYLEFLTKEIGLDPENIYVSCFIGSEDYGIPRDNESAQIWQKLFNKAGVSSDIAVIGSKKDGDKRGIKPGERIFFYDDGENWWSRAGGIKTTPVGDPCGPDSEVFYDFGGDGGHPAGDDSRFLEIGNQVFMEYRRTEDGFEPLKNKNVDFGGGLERLEVVHLGTPDMFRSSLLWPIIQELERLSKTKYSDATEQMRIIADHLRGAYLLAAQGLTPSNKSQGYAMRRLVRRAILKAQHLGIEHNFIKGIIPVIAKNYVNLTSIIMLDEPSVISILEKEENTFRHTINKGIRELNKLKEAGLSGVELFKLQDTYGFPLELSTEEAHRQGVELLPNWQAGFDAALEEQRERSKTAAKGMFKGGLADDSEQTVKYHTAAHLLLAAMKQIISESIEQKGANITAERLRFDFAIDHKLSEDEIEKLENLVNTWVKEDLPVTSAEYDTGYALDTLHAHGQFRDKYGEKVTVYTIGDEANPISREVCGGPHVKHTGELGTLKITKEESSSAGVRRLKAILEQ